MTPKTKKLLAAQIALHTEYMTDFQRTHDYGLVKLFDAKTQTLVRPPNLMRRGNDFLAASYLHALALDSAMGDDCIDALGRSYELKLAYINSTDMSIGKRGALIQGARGGPENSIMARFKVYEGTDREHHNKDTALILMSYDHNCFITGFMLDGNTVGNLLHEGNQNTVARTITLNNFMKYGYEFGSSIPHIGWSNYRNTLFEYVKAREQRLNAADTEAVVEKWVSFADPRTLQKL